MKKEMWKEVWSGRGDKVKEFDPIKLDGWDTSTSNITSDMVNQIILEIKKKLELNKNASLLEVGCGAGMVFIPLSKIVRKIYGIDYSESLLRRLKEVLNNCELKIAEANKIPYEDNYFENVLCHGVFQYFTSLKYTEEVISEMVRISKSPGKILIMDIYDFDSKEEYTKFRRSFDQKDYNPEIHTFYSKEFFKKSATKHNLEIDIYPVNIKDYLSNKYRFNVLFKK